MSRSDVLKVVAAFVAGVLLTMAFLVYSRTDELNQLRKAAQKAPSSKLAPPAGAQGTKPLAMAVHKVEPTSKKPSPIQVPEPGVPIQVPHTDQPAQHGSGLARKTASSIVTTAVALDPAASALNSGAQDRSAQSISARLQTEPPDAAETTPVSRKPKVVTLQPGTPLTIRLEQSVSTDRNHTGELFRGSLDAPLTVNGLALAETGASVLGQIIRAKRARLLRGKSDLRLTLTEITMSDGQRVRIETSLWEEKGARNSIGDTPKMALGALVGALSVAARGAGFVSNNNAGARKSTLVSANNRTLVLTAGARLTFRLARPVAITEKLNSRR